MNRLSRMLSYVVPHSRRNMLLLARGFSSKMPVDFPDMGPPIPEFVKKENESIEILRSRLLYQSRKRGMSENGLLLSNFAATYLKDFSREQLDDFDTLINKPSNDWDIFYWILGKSETPEEFDTPIMNMLKKYIKNENMEARYHQPDLQFDEK